MQILREPDLWERLATTQKRVVLYGMGNGADKILAACAQKGIEVSGVFASDGFVREKCFHGFPVVSWSRMRERYGAENLVVLLSFGSSRPDVLQTIGRVAAEAELYAPDVPAFGDGLFDRAFFERHRGELEAAFELLSDNESRRIFENVVNFKLSGRISYLLDARSDPREVMERLVRPTELRASADLGAYNGDTVRELLGASGGSLRRVWAMEPDARNYKKLALYAEGETRAEVLPIHAGAWSHEELLRFDASGNRNASFGENRSAVLSDRPVKWSEIEARSLDAVLAGAAVDYIKYDVEGAEREALLGSDETIRAYLPTLLVSLYHRNEDLFALPLLIRERFPDYRGFYLRRFAGIPAWDLNLYVRKEKLLPKDDKRRIDK